jgi:hypothetical protein
MHRSLILLALALCAVATPVVDSTTGLAQPAVKKKTGGGTALDRPTFGERFMMRGGKTTGTKRRGNKSNRKGGTTGWSQFYRSF